LEATDGKQPKARCFVTSSGLLLAEDTLLTLALSTFHWPQTQTKKKNFARRKKREMKFVSEKKKESPKKRLGKMMMEEQRERGGIPPAFLARAKKKGIFIENFKTNRPQRARDKRKSSVER
jgi:hypothetical protein